MPQTRTTCPRCRQPVVAEIDHLFDVNTNPQAKQRLLSGAFNIIHCPNCGYEGNVASPIVYHDPEKELLLTFFPPELGLPLNEQERMIGPLINQVVNKLPVEKRKGYIFRPQSVLTMQGLVERILEADGITREMIQAQQQRLNLLQRLVTASPEARQEIVRNEKDLVDESFFGLLGRLMEAAIASGDEQSASQLVEVQQVLMEETDIGRDLKEQSEEVDAAIKSLQDLSKKGLTRESLLELIIAAPTETRVTTLVSMTRGGLDYAFFQLLSERIDRSSPEERPRLVALRDQLLKLTDEIDKEVKVQVEQTHRLLDTILQAENIEEAVQKNLPMITQMFVDVVSGELQDARSKGNLDRSAKLQQVISTIQKFSSPPPEYMLIEELLTAENETDRRSILEKNADKINPEFLQLLSSLIAQTQQQNQEPELVKQLEAVHRLALRFSMEANLKK